MWYIRTKVCQSGHSDEDKHLVVVKLDQTHDVRNGFAAVHGPFHNPILVNADRGQQVKRVLVTGIDPIKDQANHNFLPRWATFVPELRFLEIYDIANVLHDAVERPRGQHFIFVVIGDRDQQFRVSVVHCRSEVVAVPQGKFVGVTGGRSVCFAIRTISTISSTQTYSASV